jgi:hypothetical protein
MEVDAKVLNLQHSSNIFICIFQNISAASINAFINGTEYIQGRQKRAKP